MAGSALGAAIGFLLIRFLAGNPVGLVFALVFWIGFCAGAASLVRHFRSYGLLLAGYTAAVVALSGLREPALESDLAWGRVACTVIGIVASGVTTAAFAARAERNPLRESLVRLIAGAAKLAASVLVGQEPQQVPAAAEGKLLTTIIALESQLDTVSAGSLSAHLRSRAARQLFATLVMFMAEVRAATLVNMPKADPAPAARAIAGLERFASLVADGADSVAKEKALGEIAPDFPSIAFALRSADQGLQAFDAAGEDDPRSLLRLSSFQYPDWASAGTAAARTIMKLLAMSAVWLLSGWSEGPIMLMSAAIFVTLFSSHDDPSLAVREVLKGTLIGATAGLAWRLFLLPDATNQIKLVILIAPFLAFSAYGMTRPSTAKAAIDGNMSFLLVTQPALPVASDASLAVAQSSAIVVGVVAAVLAFRFILPISSTRSGPSLVKKLYADVRLLGGANSRLSVFRRRGRMIQRLLRAGHAPHRSAPDLAENTLSLLSFVTALAALVGHRENGTLRADQQRGLQSALKAISASPEAWPQHADNVFEILATAR